MTSYSNMAFTGPSLLTSIIQDQLPEVGAFAALVEVEASIRQRLVDSELQRHRFLGLIAEGVIRPVLHAVEGVELVDHVDARLVDPDTDVVAGLVGHTRASAPAAFETTDTEGSA